LAVRFVVHSAPAVAAAIALGISDVLAKLILAAEGGVLTTLAFRSVVGLAFVTTWLYVGRRPRADARVRFISFGTGILFAGLIFCLFKAIEAIDVPTAVLTYFSYPLLTGLSAAAAGLDRLRWQGLVCALAAFFGLAVMIGAHPAGLAVSGIAFGLGAACCRTGVLLITRAFLVGEDARLTTW
jgi:drug/metabolite transporter (DMT)-like permease